MIVFTGPGPVEESGVFGDIRHEFRLSGLGDHSGDPFSEMIQPPLHPAFINAVRNFDFQRIAVQ